MRGSTIILASLMLLAGCKGAGSSGSISESAAAKIAAEAEASFTGGDSKAIMAHYAPGAVIFDPGTNAPSRDRAQQTKWTDALIAMHPRNFDPGKRIVQPLDADTFISSGLSSIQIETSQGLQTVHLRYSDVFRKQADGKWLIVHEHNSALPVMATVGTV